MKSRFTLTETTLEQARTKCAQFLARMDRRAPIRLQPCIVIGPTEGYIVVELGIATANGWTIVN